MKIFFMSSKDNNEKRLIHFKIKIVMIIDDDIDELIR